MRKKVSLVVYLEECQADALKTINAETRVPKAELVRQAIDLWLHHVDKHPQKFGGAP